MTLFEFVISIGYYGAFMANFTICRFSLLAKGDQS